MKKLKKVGISFYLWVFIMLLIFIIFGLHETIFYAIGSYFFGFALYRKKKEVK